VLQNRVRSRKCVPKRAEAMARRRKVRIADHHEIRITTMRRIRWEKHMAYMACKENAYALDFGGKIFPKKNTNET
jgi:hypothetical protein